MSEEDVEIRIIKALDELDKSKERSKEIFDVSVIRDLRHLLEKVGSDENSYDTEYDRFVNKHGEKIAACFQDLAKKHVDVSHIVCSPREDEVISMISSPRRAVSIYIYIITEVLRESVAEELERKFFGAFFNGVSKNIEELSNNYVNDLIKKRKEISLH